MVIKKRAERRALTIAYGSRARDEHLRWVHPTGVLDCVCERSVWRFAKRKSVGCNCRGRSRNNPKYGAGVCCGVGAMRQAVVQRIAGKRAMRAWVKEIRSGVDPDDVLL